MDFLGLRSYVRGVYGAEPGGGFPDLQGKTCWRTS